MNPFRRLLDFISYPSHSRTMGVLAFLIVVLAIPLTVNIAQKQQELRQQAATTTACEQNGGTCTGSTCYKPKVQCLYTKYGDTFPNCSRGGGLNCPNDPNNPEGPQASYSCVEQTSDSCTPPSAPSAEPPSTTCVDSNCPLGNFCQNNQCVPVPNQVSCATQPTCPAGYVVNGPWNGKWACSNNQITGAERYNTPPTCPAGGVAPSPATSTPVTSAPASVAPSSSPEFKITLPITGGGSSSCQYTCGCNNPQGGPAPGHIAICGNAFGSGACYSDSGTGFEDCGCPGTGDATSPQSWSDGSFAWGGSCNVAQGAKQIGNTCHYQSCEQFRGRYGNVSNGPRCWFSSDVKTVCQASPPTASLPECTESNLKEETACTAKTDTCNGQGTKTITYKPRTNECRPKTITTGPLTECNLQSAINNCATGKACSPAIGPSGQCIVQTPASPPVSAGPVAPGNIVLTFALKLDGLGTLGDRGTGSQKTNPARKSRNVTVDLIGASGTTTKTGSLRTDNLQTTVDMGALPTGEYTIKVKVEGFLKRNQGRFSLTTGTNNEKGILPVALPNGNINNDLTVDAQDYSAMNLSSCFGKVATGDCVKSDLDDDGQVTLFDLNLLLREMAGFLNDE